MNLPYDKYCVYLNNFPFIDNRGTVGMCCKNNTALDDNPERTIKNYPLKELYNSVAMQQKRQQVLDGVCPTGCNICYSHEKNIDQWSFRTRALKSMCDQLGFEKMQTFDDNVIRALDLRTGNTCNLNCIMCHPSDSSKWKQIYSGYAREVTHKTEKHIDWIKEYYNKLDWAEHESSWENIINSIDENCKKIYIAGGEPFYIKNFADYVEKIIHITKDPFIEINTNSTRMLSQSAFKKLKGKLNLRISIDGFEDTDNYQRTGGTEWEEKINVLDQYYKYFNVIAFDVTLTSLTIRSFPKLVDFLRERYPSTRSILVRPVTNRIGLQPNVLPSELTKDVVHYLKKLERRNYYQKSHYRYINVNQILDMLKEQKDDKEALLKQITYFDKITTKKYSEIDPQLVEWLNA